MPSTHTHTCMYIYNKRISFCFVCLFCLFVCASEKKNYKSFSHKFQLDFDDTQLCSSSSSRDIKFF